VADLRDYLAEERTFLAWIRTGIALMGFGLLLGHFDLFAGEFSGKNASGMNLHESSLWFGMLLVAVGVAVNLFSAWRHTRRIGALQRGQPTHGMISWQGVFLALLLALFGVGMAIFSIAPSGQARSAHVQSVSTF
jgi:putative membrane protein